MTVVWARALSSKPAFIPTSRGRGAKAAGKRYEQALAKELPKAIHGQWFVYGLSGETKSRFCQTDFLLPFDDFFIVIEAKYTWIPEAKKKLQELYVPVVRLAFGKKSIGLVVCKNLTTESPQASPVLLEALAIGGVWHWWPPVGKATKTKFHRPAGVRAPAHALG